MTELTFIVCARGSGDNPSTEVTGSDLTMIGDVNLFLKGEKLDPDYEVEVEIMIAGESRQASAPRCLRCRTVLWSAPSMSFSEPAIRKLTCLDFTSLDPLDGRAGLQTERSSADCPAAAALVCDVSCALVRQRRIARATACVEGHARRPDR